MVKRFVYFRAFILYLSLKQSLDFCWHQFRDHPSAKIGARRAFSTEKHFCHTHKNQQDFSVTAITSSRRRQADGLRLSG